MSEFIIKSDLTPDEIEEDIKILNKINIDRLNVKTDKKRIMYMKALIKRNFKPKKKTIEKYKLEFDEKKKIWI